MTASTKVNLRKTFFGDAEHVIASHGGMTASLFRYETGIEAVRLKNERGYLVILPFMGQMIWDAVFDGVDLTMENMFSMPRPANVIVETYGCFAFHSGLLTNGCPGPTDTHPLHGEMPCAEMDSAAIEFGHDDDGAFMAISGTREYVMGFGAHYMARPRVVLRPDATLFDIQMNVENLSGAAMDLMYMCHVNFAFCDGAQIIQPAGFTPTDTIVRTEVPAHVPRNPDYDAFLETLAQNPAAMETLDEPHRYDPEQVFYIRNAKTDAHGNTACMMRRVEGDGFHITYNTNDFPKTVRWILANQDQKVAAFALPSTCEPEGFNAEKAKGHVISLRSGETRNFSVRLGSMTQAESDTAEQAIRSL
jgi:hypothetical protein